MTSTPTDYYELYWSSSGYRPRTPAPLALRHLLAPHLGPSTRVLDFGCGDGHSLGTWLASRVGGYVGVDISSTAVSEARSLGLDARLMSPDRPLPIADGEFDLALCVEVLEHLLSPQEAGTALFRALRQGGTVVATVPNIAYWRRRLDLALFGRWNPMGDDLAVEQPWRDPHIRFFTAQALRRFVEGAGFTSVRIGGHSGSLLHDLPVLRRGTRRERGSSLIYRGTERAWPAMLALRLAALGVKPAVTRMSPVTQGDGAR